MVMKGKIHVGDRLYGHYSGQESGHFMGVVTYVHDETGEELYELRLDHPHRAAFENGLLFVSRAEILGTAPAGMDRESLETWLAT